MSVPRGNDLTDLRRTLTKCLSHFKPSLMCTLGGGGLSILEKNRSVGSIIRSKKGRGNAFMPLPNGHTKRLGRKSSSDTLRIVKNVWCIRARSWTVAPWRSSNLVLFFFVSSPQSPNPSVEISRLINEMNELFLPKILNYTHIRGAV